MQKTGIYIITKRLIVRNFRDSDFRDVYEYLSDPETYIYEPGEPQSLDRCRELVRERAKSNTFLAIELPDEKKVIGHLYFYAPPQNDFMIWELGYASNKKYRRKGYASEASAALVEYAFKNFKAHRVIAECDPRNTASWKLLEKIGMQREGHLKRNIFFRQDSDGNPIWLDTYIYAINEHN